MNPLSKEYQTRRRASSMPAKTKDCASAADSAVERDFAAHLEAERAKGLIDNIRHHPGEIQLTKKVKWKIDYIVFHHGLQCDVAIDCKGGLEDGRFRTILQLWPEFGPMPLQIWTRAKGRFICIKQLRGAR